MAQATAFGAAVEGAIAKDVDKAGRDFISMMGRGQYFTHRLGHGKQFLQVSRLVYESNFSLL
jgi:Xaa-Pro aminopeptidase